jgi:hypothetical protein
MSVMISSRILSVVFIIMKSRMGVDRPRKAAGAWIFLASFLAREALA